jgi:hypothetical protein
VSNILYTHVSALLLEVDDGATFRLDGDALLLQLRHEGRQLIRVARLSVFLRSVAREKKANRKYE